MVEPRDLSCKGFRRAEVTGRAERQARADLCLISEPRPCARFAPVPLW
jgi:hypothetical protein